MKVLLVNGSSRKKGCTNAALCEVERALQEAGIGTEQFFIGNEALPDCVACRKCRETGRCVFHDSVAFMNKNAESRARRLFAGVNSSLSRTDPEFVEIISNFSQDETANANILTEKERMLCILAPCLAARAWANFRTCSTQH